MVTKKKSKKKASNKKKPDENRLVLSQSGNVANIRSAINTQFNTVIAPEVKDKPTIILPGGILSLDLAVGNGGFVTGRIMDIYGWEGTGKTLLCLAIAGYIQRCTKIDSQGNTVNRVAAMLDAEGTYSNPFAASAGVDTENLILVQSTPDKILSGEDYFDILTLLVGQGVDYIIVDSCPALVPSTVIINDTGEGKLASQAQLMARGLAKNTPLINACGQTLVHFVNQMRGKPMDLYKTEQETGGNALKFYSSYRFQVVRAEAINKKVLGADGQFREKKVGVTSCVRIIKNKTAPIPAYIPSTTYHFEFDVYFESFKDDSGMEYHRGVDVVKDYCETGIRTGVVKQASSWFSFGSIKANGRTELYQKVRADPQIMSEIRGEVFEKIGGVPTSPNESMLPEEDEVA